MSTQVTEGIAPAERLYATYGACLHQAAATHKDSEGFFRFSFDVAVLALNAGNIMVMSLYEMYSQGLQEWRAKWEAAGERPPCLEADPTPFILEEERVAMERAIKLVKELRDDPKKIGPAKKRPPKEAVAAQRAATRAKLREPRSEMLNRQAEVAVKQSKAAPPKLVAAGVPDTATADQPAASISASISGEKGRKV